MKKLNLLMAAIAVTAGQTLAEEGSPTGAPASWGTPMMGSEPYWMVLVDRLEYGDSDDGDTRLWDARAWYGGDYNKVYLETEGEGPTGQAVDDAEFQVLYDRLVSPFWSLRGGLRHDVRPSAADTTYATFGLQGLAPQWFESDLSAFISEDGDVRLRGEFEYHLLLTQRLVLAPRLEVQASLDEVPELGLASGINRTEAGIRLRYEIRREIAPYVGVRWERIHGDARRFAREEGEPTSSTAFVVGLRAWF